MSLGVAPEIPEAIALPQALQAQMQTAIQQNAGPAAQSGQAPTAPAAQPGQAPAAQPAAPADPMQDAELAQFFVDADQPPPAAAQPQGYTPQAPQQPQGYPPQQPQGYAPAPDALARIEQAQLAMMQALRQNAAGFQQAGGGAPTNAGQPPVAEVQTGLQIAIEDAQFTDEERQALQGREALFEKLFQRFTKQKLEPHLQRMAEAYNQATAQIGRLEQNSAASQQQTIRQIIAARVPDFDTVLQQPQFREFVREMVPEVGVTRGDILREAVRRGDIGLIHHHVSQYKARHGGQAPDGSQAMLTMQQPQAQQRAPQAPQGQQTTRRVTPDTLLQAEAEMMKGRLSPEKFTKLVDIFRSQEQTSRQAPAQTGFRPA